MDPLADVETILTELALADMATAIDSSALLVYRAAWQQDEGGTDNRRAAAMSPNLRIAFRFLTAKKRAMLMSLSCTVLGVGLFIDEIGKFARRRHVRRDQPRANGHHHQRDRRGNPHQHHVMRDAQIHQDA